MDLSQEFYFKAEAALNRNDFRAAEAFSKQSVFNLALQTRHGKQLSKKRPSRVVL